MSSGQPLHTNCRFSGQRVCRCVYGNSAILASRSDAEPAPDAAEAYMQRARAAWRLLHHPDSPALRDHEPVVLWLPRLEKRAARPATSAAVAAAAAQVRRAEAAARAAVVRAAGLAAAAGLPFRLPDQLQAQLGGSPLDLGGLVQADHSELERQVHALHHAQQAQQVAPAAGGTSLPTPNVAPLPAAAAATSSDGLLPPGSSGRPVQRSRSLDAGPVGGGPPQLAGAQSLPLPSRTASGSAGARARRSPASKPRTRTVPGTGQAGPVAGSCGSLRGTRRASSGSPRQGGAAGAGGPSLAPFGSGYKPRGASAAAPPSKWLLTMRDFTPALRGKHVQTFWPGSGRWLPAVVLAVSLPARTCTLYYETGDEQSLDFPPLVHAGEVAWLRGPPTAAVASASGGSQGASGSPLLQPGSLPPLSPGLCSPSQQSLHSTDQQQDQQRAAHEGVSPRRQRSETVPAEAAGQAAEPSGERLAGRAGSMPSDPASGRPSPAVHGPAGPTQSEEGGLRKGGDMGPDAGCRDAAELLPALGSPGEAACPGSELLVGTAELPGPLAPPPVALREHEGQGPGGVAAPADKEGAAPAEQRDDQLRQPALNGLRAQADAPPPAEQHERQPEQQDHRLLQDNCQLEPAQQPELAQHAGAAPPGCQPKQDDAVPVVEEEQPEQAVAGGADEQQAAAVPALASGIAAPLLPCASAEQREEQAALALAAAPQEAARVQEQLPPLQPPDQVQPSAVEEPGPGQQGAPDAEALGTLDQPQGARQPDVPAPQL